MNRYLTIALMSWLMCTFCTEKTTAQDIHHSQFYTSPLHLNPALTGMFNGDVRVAANYRSQWYVDDLVKYQTLAVNADMKILPRRMDARGFWSAGLVFNYDRAGDSKLSLTNLGLAASYTYALNRQNLITAGANTSINQRRFRTDDLIWDNQIVNGKPNPDLDPLEDFSNTSKLFPDFSAGVNYRWQKSNRTNFNLGGGLFHLTEPDQSFFEKSTSSPLNRRVALYAISSFKLTQRVDLLVHGLYQSQGPYEELQLGGYGKFYLNVNRGKELAVLLGAGFRNGDSFAPKIAVEWTNWYAGFSYDANYSDFQEATDRRGGPEFSLIYRMTKVKPLPQFKNCPIF